MSRVAGTSPMTAVLAVARPMRFPSVLGLVPGPVSSLVAGLLVGIATVPAPAQVAPADWGPAFDACLADAARPAACVGAAADPCVARLAAEGGSRAEADCRAAEMALWRDRVAGLQLRLREAARAEDTGRASTGRANTHLAERTSDAEARAWRDWARARCAHEAARVAVDGPGNYLTDQRCTVRLLARRLETLQTWDGEGF